MKKSDFKFSNPILLKTNFLVNKEFKNNENVVIDNSFNVSIIRHNTVWYVVYICREDIHVSFINDNLKIVVGGKNLRYNHCYP